MILFLCPIVEVKSAGVRMLHRQVQVLVDHGIAAAIIYDQPGGMPDLPDVPRAYYADHPIRPDDTFVIPEGLPHVMDRMKSFPQRRILIALNWDFIYEQMPARHDLRSYGIERVITHCRQIAGFVEWTMRLPTHLFGWGIRPDLYGYAPAEKKRKVVYIQRKEGSMPKLKAALWSRNPDLIDRIEWLALDRLPEAVYAQHVREASVFLNMSPAEGLPCSLLEAMRAGTIVAGCNSVGGREQLIGDGPEQNCILAQNLDYDTLARKLEPLLLDLLAGDTTRWDNLRQHALRTSAPFTPEAEAASIVQMWREIGL